MRRLKGKGVKLRSVGSFKAVIGKGVKREIDEEVPYVVAEGCSRNCPSVFQKDWV